ncbi:hypothetical protein [Vibrio sp. 99-70-13A1]|uniref:hypothetical protein n=1 Tax=Vibrio sp. 99-70-13A1 TaxID=2607601 RepID=UPI001C10C1B6|nr:hypothetical protein [Vibrio sp. 99-70-13A1]
MNYLKGSAEERLERKIKEEKEHLWKDVISLKETLKHVQESLALLEKSAPEHFKKVIGARNSVSNIRNKSEKQLEEIQEIVIASEEGKSFISQMKAEIGEWHHEIDVFHGDSSLAAEAIVKSHIEFEEKKEAIEVTLHELSGLVDERLALSEKLSTISEQVEASESLSKRLKSLLSNATNERNEILEVYKEIFGYTFENEEGEEKVVVGLQKALDSSYLKIKEDLGGLSSSVAKAKQTQEQTLKSYEEDFKLKTAEFIETAEAQKEGILEKISSLLPSAMTAGLSAAYADKIKVEQEQLKKHDRSFMFSIIGLIICSSVPVIFTLVRVVAFREDFAQVFKEAPSLFSMMLPLYTPILWVAYSSNKNYKLSKRLIEEYTHKEVSSRTFEGLSTQISRIGEDDTSGELRTRLLFNLLQVNSENPGKLISDYNNSDHPIIDAIDKSSKLADAIKKLDNVPVVGQLLKHMSAKEQEKIDEKTREAEILLSTQLSERNKNQDTQSKLDS